LTIRVKMPRISEKQMITEGFEALCANPDFPYTMEDLMSWVFDTSFRCRFVDNDSKRPLSGYNLFFKESRSSFEKVSDLASYWSSLSLDDKDLWKLKATQHNLDSTHNDPQAPKPKPKKRGPSSWNRFLTSHRNSPLSFAQKRALYAELKSTHSTPHTT